MLQMKSVGPVYVGMESLCREPKIVSRAWFKEMAPPWREGKGWRLRIGLTAFQVGICHKGVEEGATPLRQLGGYEMKATPQEIGAWGAQTEQDGNEPA